MEKEKQVYDVLDGLKITYQVYQHPPVFTVADAAEHWADIPGQGCKNLFLRDAKGENHFLVVVPDEKRVDVKALSVEQGTSRLSFGSPDRLQKYLGLLPGAVSPFGIINDPEGLVRVMVDEVLMKEELVTFHPNVNTATVALSSEDFRTFLSSRKNKVSFVHIPEIQE